MAAARSFCSFKNISSSSCSCLYRKNVPQKLHGYAIPPSHFIFLHKMFGSPSIWVQVGFASSSSEQDMKGRTQEWLLDGWMDGWMVRSCSQTNTGLEVLATLQKSRHPLHGACALTWLILYLCFENSFLLSIYERKGGNVTLSGLGIQKVFAISISEKIQLLVQKGYILWGTHSFVDYVDFNRIVFTEFASFNSKSSV
jgi:hypothetical protein